MAKAALSNKAAEVGATFGNSEVTGRRAVIMAGAGLVDVFDTVESKDRGALKVSISQESRKFDKTQASEGKVRFARDGSVKPPVGYLSKESNVKNLFRVPSMFENSDFREMGYEYKSSELVRLFDTEGIRNESEWQRWCQVHVPSVKAAKKTRDAKKAKAAPKVKDTPAEYIAKQLIRAAASAGIDPTTLYSQVGNVIEEFLASESDESSEEIAA
jgi:hypothetical protein